MFTITHTDTGAGRIVWARTKRKGWFKLNFIPWAMLSKD